jgi:hypothetical protein
MIAKLARSLNPGRRPLPNAQALVVPAKDNRVRAAVRVLTGKHRLACRWQLDGAGRLTCRWALEEGAEEPGQLRGYGAIAAEMRAAQDGGQIFSACGRRFRERWNASKLPQCRISSAVS